MNARPPLLPSEFRPVPGPSRSQITQADWEAARFFIAYLGMFAVIPVVVRLFLGQSWYRISAFEITLLGITLITFVFGWVPHYLALQEEKKDAEEAVE